MGKSVKSEPEDEKPLTKQEVSELVQNFMDLESNEGKQMRIKARQVGDMWKSNRRRRVFYTQR